MIFPVTVPSGLACPDHIGGITMRLRSRSPENESGVKRSAMVTVPFGSRPAGATILAVGIGIGAVIGTGAGSLLSRRALPLFSFPPDRMVILHALHLPARDPLDERAQVIFILHEIDLRSVDDQQRRLGVMV